MAIHQAKRVLVLGLYLLAALAMLSTAVLAQETLRWKLEKGEQLKFHRRHQRVMRGTVGDQPLNQALDRETDVTLVVDSVDEDGTAHITQTIDRVRYSQTTPSGTIEFDSSKPPTGDGGQLASSLQPLVGLDFTYRMSARGEVTKLELSEASKKRLADKPTVLPAGKEAELLRQLIPSVSLPKEESVSAGATWTDTVELAEPRVGTREVTSTYEYTGSHESDGRWLADIEVRGSTKLKPSAKAPVEIQILDESITGNIHFDPLKGSLVERKETEKTKSRISMEGQTFEQETENVVTVKRTGEGAKEAETTKTP